ncbi:MAG: hypothetical protein Q7R79_02930, partial [bacterium]|nr:hypothetical protein [bacterium]
DGFRQKDFPSEKCVLLKEEFWGYRRAIGLQCKPLLFSRPISLAKPEYICPECGNGWNFGNLHDVVSMTITRSLHLAAFEGKALQSILEFLSKIRNGDYRVFPEKVIKRDTLWLGDQDGISNHTIIQVDDELWVRVIQYRHLLCDATLAENT